MKKLILLISALYICAPASAQAGFVRHECAIQATDMESFLVATRELDLEDWVLGTYVNAMVGRLDNDELEEGGLLVLKTSSGNAAIFEDDEDAPFTVKVKNLGESGYGMMAIDEDCLDDLDNDSDEALAMDFVSNSFLNAEPISRYYELD